MGTPEALAAMTAEVGRFPDILLSGADSRFERKLPRDGIGRVILAGMGGSGIAGDVVADWARDAGRVPVDVWKYPDLPAWADAGTLVAVSSYSGETRESLSVFRQALARGCPVAVLAQGGTLLREAEEASVPIFRYEPGMQPRSALPAGIAGFAKVLDRVAGTDFESDIRRAVPDLQRLARRHARPDGLAAKVAASIGARTPVVYCPPDIPGAGIRWKGQVSENSKTAGCSEVLSHRRSLPEWSRRGATDSFVPVFLYEEEAQRSVKTCFDACIEDARKRGADAKIVKVKGSTVLQRSLYAILLGDYVSLFLAKAKGVDPMDVAAIRRLKEIQTKAVEGSDANVQ